MNGSSALKASSSFNISLVSSLLNRLCFFSTITLTHTLSYKVPIQHKVVFTIAFSKITQTESGEWLIFFWLNHCTSVMFQRENFQSLFYTNLKLPVMLYDHLTFLIVPCYTNIWTKVVQQSILQVVLQNY